MTMIYHILFFFFFFNDTATTEIYPLSLHDALPLTFALIDWAGVATAAAAGAAAALWTALDDTALDSDRIALLVAEPSSALCCSGPLIWSKGTVAAKVGRLCARRCGTASWPDPSF